MAAKKPENKLTSDILGALRARGAWVNKTHGNIYSRGLPDITGIYRRVGIGLEVKLPGKQRTLTPLQAVTLKAIRKAGGEAYMVTTVEQALGVLRKIDKEHDAR